MTLKTKQPLAGFATHRTLALDYPMHSCSSGPNLLISSPTIVFSVSLNVFFSMAVLSVQLPICTLISSFCFLVLGLELLSLFYNSYSPGFIVCPCFFLRGFPMPVNLIYDGSFPFFPFLSLLSLPFFLFFLLNLISLLIQACTSKPALVSI